MLGTALSKLAVATWGGVEGSKDLTGGLCWPLGAEHAQGGQHPTAVRQRDCPPAEPEQQLSGRGAQAMEQGDGGGLGRKRRRGGDESKVPFFHQPLGKQSSCDFSMSDLVATGKKACCPSTCWERARLGSSRAGERSHAEAVGGY